MKVIAFQSEENVIVFMSVEELLKLAGFGHADGFNKQVGHKVACYADRLNMDKKSLDTLMGCEIHVSAIYDDAKETLKAYSELKTKMESIRNQLTTLTNKMNREEETQNE